VSFHLLAHTETHLISEPTAQNLPKPATIFHAFPPLPILLLQLQRTTGTNAHAFGLKGIPIINPHSELAGNTPLGIGTNLATSIGTIAIATTTSIGITTPGFGNAQCLVINTGSHANTILPTTTTNELPRGVHGIRGTHTFFKSTEGLTVNGCLDGRNGIHGDSAGKKEGTKFGEKIHVGHTRVADLSIDKTPEQRKAKEQKL